MASYVVMKPPGGGGEDAVLVRDGFHFLAFLVPALWLLFQRLWLEAALALLLAVMLGALGRYAGLGPASSVLSLLVGIYVGIEGAALKLAALRRRGWREWGVVEAENARDAELRYLANDDDHVEPDAAAMTAAPIRPATPYRPASGPALGLFGYPGRN